MPSINDDLNLNLSVPNMKTFLRCIGSAFLLGMLVWTIAISVAIAPAHAAIRQLEEAPGQMLYQSRQSLQDQTGTPWQAIAFKRIHPEGSTIISLRLIGLSDGTALDHAQPLTLNTSLGKTLTAQDISRDISQETATPANVGEYDIKLALSQLQAEIPLQLTVPTLDGKAVWLSVPAAAIQEWQTLASS